MIHPTYIQREYSKEKYKISNTESTSERALGIPKDLFRVEWNPIKNTRPFLTDVVALKHTPLRFHSYSYCTHMNQSLTCAKIE